MIHVIAYQTSIVYFIRINARSQIDTSAEGHQFLFHCATIVYVMFDKIMGCNEGSRGISPITAHEFEFIMTDFEFCEDH
jgi:hypothetical protein